MDENTLIAFINSNEFGYWMKTVNDSHATQRYGDRPYSYHLEMVTDVAVRHLTMSKSAYFTGSFKEILMAAYGHDLLEDTKIRYDHLVRESNEETGRLIYLVSDEFGRNRAERKAKTYPKIATDQAAIFIKLCDRIANVAHAKYVSDDADKFRMYQDEHDEFFKALRACSDYHLDGLWNELGHLIYD